MDMKFHNEAFEVLLKQLATRGIIVRTDGGLTKAFNWIENKDGSIEFYIDGRIIVKPTEPRQ